MAIYRNSITWIKYTPKSLFHILPFGVEYAHYTLCVNSFIDKGKRRQLLIYRDHTMRKIALTLTMLLGLVASAQAVEGDAEAGKAKSATCVACHGTDGNSALTIYPKIAGQHAEYIYKQLKEFKSGTRQDPVMAGMVAALSDQDMKDLAAYFSSQTMSAGETPEDVVEAGQYLYRGGDMERGIPACIACHGPRGVGHSLAGFLKVSFQHPDYIKAQLEKFRSGARANDKNGMMRDIAVKLTDKDIEILSKYMAGLH